LRGSILDPVGPIGADDSKIFIDALLIMLAIVIPTILLAFWMAWRYRASNTKAEYLPYWSYSGRIEAVVWAIPVLTIMFIGGVIWIGSYRLDPFKPLPSTSPPLEVQVVSLDWKWLFIYPQQGVATVNQLVVPAGVPVHFSITSASVFNVFFVPRLGSMIYAMPGMVSQLNLQADRPAVLIGQSSHFSGDGFLRHAVPGEERRARRVRELGADGSWRRAHAGPGRIRGALPAESAGDAHHLQRGRSATLPRHRHPEDRSGPGPEPGAPPTRVAKSRREASTDVRQARLVGNPFDQPIALITSLVLIVVILGVLGLVTARAGGPTCGASGSPPSTTSASASCTASWRGDADPRLRRCDHDAQPAGHSDAGAGVPDARALQPDLLGARHDHDLLRGHAAGDRLHELRAPLQLGVRDVAFPTLNSSASG
jgi:cytochrome o ubiquinol oxidase subunit II